MPFFSWAFFDTADALDCRHQRKTPGCWSRTINARKAEYIQKGGRNHGKSQYRNSCEHFQSTYYRNAGRAALPREWKPHRTEDPWRRIRHTIDINWQQREASQKERGTMTMRHHMAITLILFAAIFFIAGMLYVWQTWRWHLQSLSLRKKSLNI